MTKPFLGNENFVDESGVEYWQKEIFDQTKPGTVLYCEMPLEQKFLSRIPQGHRSRPYVIVKKGEQNLYGYALATHPLSNLGYDQLFRLKNFAYDYEMKEYKDSFIQLDKPYRIPISKIMDTFYELDTDTIYNLELQIRALEQKRNTRLMRFNLAVHPNLVYILQIGDVVAYKNQYYFVGEIRKKQYFILLPIVCKNQKTERYYDVSLYLEKNKSYFVDVDESCELTVDMAEYKKLQLVKRKSGSIVKGVNRAKRKYREYVKKHPFSEKKEKEYRFEFGDVLENKVNHTQHLFLATYKNVHYVISKENYNCGVVDFIKIKPVVMEIKGNIFSEKQDLNYRFLKLCVLQFGKELGEEFSKSDNFQNMKTKVGIKKNNVFYNIRQVFPIGTIVSKKYSEYEYIYLFTYKKVTYALHMEEAAEGMTNPVCIRISGFKAMDELTDETVVDLLMDLKKTRLVKRNEEIQLYIEKQIMNLQKERQL